VATELLAGVLPYTNRQSLLARAGQMGIARFEATLIIAAVQHRMNQPAFTPEPQKPSKKSHIPWVLALSLAVEILIVLTVVHALTTP
jgi:hypothetical protein